MPEAALLDLLLDVDRKLFSAGGAGPLDLDFYELLYATACQIAPTDAFYVCLYDEDEDTLFFPANWEGDSFETCTIKRPGSGPTSRVIRRRTTYSADEDSGAVQHGGGRFGDVSRPSLSAIHAPMLARDLQGEERLHGVISMQCYRKDVYTTRTVRLFEWLAGRAGQALQAVRDRAEAAAGSETGRLREQTNAFNQLLNEITRRSDHLRTLLDEAQDPALKEAIRDLCRACYRGQSRAVLYAYEPDAVPSSPNGERQDPFVQLTPRERGVLCLLARHRTYVQMALELGVELSTIKSHVASILRKLDVASRQEAAELAEPFRSRHETFPHRG